MLNYEKVKKYMEAKINEYAPYYPQTISEGVTCSVSGGSFGSCLISIKGPRFNINDEYVAKYADIEQKISYFFCRCDDLQAQEIKRMYKKEQAKNRSFTLDIYNGKTKVNTITSYDPLTVAHELNKIIVSEKIRLVKTRWQHIPYTNDIKITQTFEAERYGLQVTTKYCYLFKNCDF